MKVCCLSEGNNISLTGDLLPILYEWVQPLGGWFREGVYGIDFSWHEKNTDVL